MLVRNEVSGVRSSCDASATSWRCCSRSAGQRGQHLVERGRKPPHLVRSALVDRGRQILGTGDLFGRDGQSSDRAQRTPGEGKARGDRDRDHHAADDREEHRQRLQGVVGLGQRARHLHGDVVPGGHGQESLATPIHLDVPHGRRTGRSRRYGPVLVVDGKRDRIAARAIDDLAIRGDDLERGLRVGKRIDGRQPSTGSPRHRRREARLRLEHMRVGDVARRHREFSPLLELAIDVVEQLAAHRRITDHGHHDDRNRDGRAGDQRQSRA